MFRLAPKIKWPKRPPFPEHEKVAEGDNEGVPSYFALCPYWSWGRESRQEKKNWILRGYIIEYSPIDWSRSDIDYSALIGDIAIDADELSEWESSCAFRYVEDPEKVQEIMKEHFSHLLSKKRTGASKHS